MNKNYFIDNYSSITFMEMIEFIEENHPEDRKTIAEQVIMCDSINFFRFKSLFYHLYFPEIYEKKAAPSSIVLGWLTLE